MSRRRTAVPLIEYSLTPSRKTSRVILTSSKSKSKCRSALSKITDTEARLSLLETTGPEKIRSSPRLPRSDLSDCSPSAQRKASATLLLPEPFGPTMAVIGASKKSVDFLPNDLKPLISRDFSCISFIESTTPGQSPAV